jgi:hypothetical protein
VARASSNLVDPLTGGAALDELPRLVDDKHRASSERAALGLAQSLEPTRFDAAGHVLREHEEHSRLQLARHLARIEGDQRRVFGDRRFTVEQIRVRAVLDE